MPHVDEIIVLKNGEVSEMGTYKELLSHQGAFAEFIATYITAAEEEEDVDPESIYIIIPYSVRGRGHIGNASSVHVCIRHFTDDNS